MRADGRPHLILVADDDAEIREVLVMLLGDEGYTTVEAVDGIEALDAAFREPLDLILIDVTMPRLDGPGFCEAYRAAGGTVPVVMLTAARPSDLDAMVEAYGAAPYVAKPFDVSHLLATIVRCLGT
jgi:CheY-like chemotaxis protein